MSYIKYDRVRVKISGRRFGFDFLLEPFHNRKGFGVCCTTQAKQELDVFLLPYLSHFKPQLNARGAWHI